MQTFQAVQQNVDLPMPYEHASMVFLVNQSGSVGVPECRRELRSWQGRLVRELDLGGMVHEGILLKQLSLLLVPSFLLSVGCLVKSFHALVVVFLEDIFVQMCKLFIENCLVNSLAKSRRSTNALDAAQLSCSRRVNFGLCSLGKPNDSKEFLVIEIYRVVRESILVLLNRIVELVYVHFDHDV